MKFILEYSEFLKESKGYEHGCVMAHVPVENWSQLTDQINHEDLYTEQGSDIYGIQKNPHLTLLYPITQKIDVSEIKSIIDSIVSGNLSVKIEGIDLFENDSYDVVKFNVECNDVLQNLHSELKSKIPNNDMFDVYRPHITIAYAKPGLGHKYVDPNYRYEFKNVNKIIYTRPNDTDLTIEL
jgi:hypothetical protein